MPHSDTSLSILLFMSAREIASVSTGSVPAASRISISWLARDIAAEISLFGDPSFG
jgi:hypothetical protein